jgi:DUF2924 family protein
MSRSLSEHKREKLAVEIAALQSLDVAQLRARWRTLYKTDAPSRFSRDLLMRAVAYRLQERALGELKPATCRLFQRIAADAHARRPLKLKPVRELEPGTVLIREWGGVKYKVVVREDGFSFRGQHYGSLSAVASLITGNRWSGPLFFGLKHRTKTEAGDGARQTPAAALRRLHPLRRCAVYTRCGAAPSTPVNLQTKG